MRTVIIAAAELELTPIRKRLAGCEYLIAGVGCLEAAKQAHRLASVCADKNVIVVGSCGSFAPFKSCQLIYAQKIYFLPIGERLKLSYAISDVNPTIELVKTPSWVKRLQEKAVICSPSISLSSDLANQFGSKKDYVENLELYSFVGEIHTVCRSLAVVLAITNELCEQAHSQWQQNHQEAATMVADFLYENRGVL